ncbi:UNVERIFIED_CONTAM: hypothetical protein Slati_4306500 [Sesamum latifolium]|uniref:Uncharacterized protein n=1 Tax=Sesamum latifolium TaxID=2727402 RepID=A0AAW2SLU1_9LAMI
MSLSCVSMNKRALPSTRALLKSSLGQQPLLHHTLDSPQSVRSPLARNFSQEWKQNVDIARSCLEKAQKRMKKYADQNRRFIEFNAGDLVMVKVPDRRVIDSNAEVCRSFTHHEAYWNGGLQN